MSAEQESVIYNKKQYKYYIKLAERLVEQKQALKCTYFVGINGSQGSGKSTLAQFLSHYIIKHHHLSVAVLSLDDFYLTQAQRNERAKKIHPLFRVRGVPGTHNTDLIKQTFRQLAQTHQKVLLPRFDKARDNPYPEKSWPAISTPVDIVIIEGWCWGIPHQKNASLSQPINDFEREEDPQGIWRRSVNTFLLRDYEPLYHFMNYCIMLKAPSFACVYQWRLEQEQKLAQQIQFEAGHQSDIHIMTKIQIKHFIQYFQRLTEYALKVMPKRCDQVYYLDDQRNILSLKSSDQ